MMNNSNIKNLLCRLGIFLLPVLIIIFYIEFGLRHMPNSYALKKELLKPLAPFCEVLVLGSSQALYGIDPEFFSKPGFNFADASQSLFYDSALLLKYLNRMSRLKVVIITVSHFSLGYQLRDYTENWRDYFYYQYYGIHDPKLSLDMKMYSYIFLYSWPESRKYFLDGFSDILVSGIGPLGWQNKGALGHVPDNSLSKQRVESHENLMTQKNYQENERLLDTLLSELKKRNIKCVLVYMPASIEYMRYAHESIRKENMEILNNLVKTYSPVLLNFWGDPRFTPDLFADEDHLNSRGAGFISRLIDKEVIQNLSN